jgi:RHS repeat-associated protein
VQWQQTYKYDRYGNRTIDQDVLKTYGAGINKKDFTVNPVNNHLGVPGGQSGTMTYDNAGNLTTDTYSGFGVTRLYDAEHRMVSETQANSYVADVYTYNGDGQRVRRIVNGEETWQVYGLAGELLEEYAANSPPAASKKEYGYRNGQLLITAGVAQACNTCPAGVGVTLTGEDEEQGIHWLVTDQLGTPRMVLGQSGDLESVRRHDYLPFGEELTKRVNRTETLGYPGEADNLRQKFTSKERDNETALDYFGARYYASMQGRFSSVDPMPVTVENFVNPQRWNSYTYVLNNPIAAVDPNGSDGEGKGGDKVISVFLRMTTEDRNSSPDPKTNRPVFEKGPNWPQVGSELNKDYSLRTFGPPAVTGDTGFPQMVNEHTFNNALKNSDLVAYVDHGDGPIGEIFIPTNGIRVGDTMYNSGGTIDLNQGGMPGPRPDTNASVVLNFSCNSAKNTDFFNLTGKGSQYVIAIDSGTSAHGGTGIGTMEKAAAAFVTAYANTKGTMEQKVQAGVKAAQSKIDNSGSADDKGDRVVIVKQTGK